jgi:hypothetical protein
MTAAQMRRPAPRANAENRANTLTEQAHYRPSPIDLEAHCGGGWSGATFFAMQAVLACALPALASLAGAFR